MKSRLTPYYIDLVYDACLKSFWRKKTLHKFLRQCGVAESFLGSWAPAESKRDLLDRLFTKLPSTDPGRRALVRMAKYLIEQRSFPDLLNLEDSKKKVADACEAVSKLREYHEKQDDEIQSERDAKKARKELLQRQQEISRSQQSLLALSDGLNNLAQKLGTQQAGYDFQDWFYDLLDFFEIPNRRPYAHDGRQSDGSLTLSGTTYLVELKFTSDQAQTADIDSFFKKVISKADNTMGLMVSISGYSSVARREASGDKTPLLLLDHGHLYLALSGIMGLSDVIERVRRHASQTGEAYLSANEFTG